MALPTSGRVIIETTVGEIDIELWAKETPKTCRNFLALAMEGLLGYLSLGYYDGVIFHRIVPNFLVQTGDKTGTGGGGESFYGEPFEDEIHPRLRFAHRGLVAMANNGQKNSNDSQFIITLDRADELHGKHTLFGRCMGDTVYNVMKIGEMEIDANERPVYPPKIKTIRIIDNPFPDIIPRITAAEKRAQQRARDEAQREREEEIRRRGAKKNVKLLSFGTDEDAPEESETAFQKKAIVRPDLLDNPQPAGIVPDFVTAPPVKPTEAAKGPRESKAESAKKKTDVDITKIREQHAKEKTAGSDSRRNEIEKMEAEIRKISKKRSGYDSDEEIYKQKAKKSHLEEELSKYEKGRGLHKKSKDGRKKDEGDILKALESFRGKLKGTMFVDEQPPTAGDEAMETDEIEGVVPKDEEGLEIDDDQGFMSHALHFPKDNAEETVKAERDYEVIDPRQRGARAKEEERERKRAEKKKAGGGKYRR